MGLLSGSASISRFNVVNQPPELDFERGRFTEIQPGSEVRESYGFVSVEPDAPYEVGHQRYAFRVRIDRLRPDTTAVRERLKQLVKSELETSGLPFVGPKKRKQLRDLAEEELILQAVPRSKIVEACIDGDLLYVASTAKNVLGTVLGLLRQIGVVAEAKTPWGDRAEEDIESQIVETYEPGEAVLGCRFLRALLDDPDILFEPENGLVRLKTHQAKVSLAGGILPELYRYVEKGAELLSAKLLLGESTFRLEAMSFRVNALRIETERHEHWIELLDERLEKIAAVYEQLDEKYAALSSRLRQSGVPKMKSDAAGRVLSFREGG